MYCLLWNVNHLISRRYEPHQRNQLIKWWYQIYIQTWVFYPACHNVWNLTSKTTYPCIPFVEKRESFLRCSKSNLWNVILTLLLYLYDYWLWSFTTQCICVKNNVLIWPRTKPKFIWLFTSYNQTWGYGWERNWKIMSCI